MVDFAAKLAEQKAKNASLINKEKETGKLFEKKKTWLDRVNHLIEFHLSEMTEWEVNFCYSQKGFLHEVLLEKSKENVTVDLGFILSGRSKNKIEELEKQYCGQMCHALKEAKEKQIGRHW